ncbi:hypothetical protein SLA2020_342970 [Shorea laevis]
MAFTNHKALVGVSFNNATNSPCLGRYHHACGDQVGNGLCSYKLLYSSQCPVGTGGRPALTQTTTVWQRPEDHDKASRQPTAPWTKENPARSGGMRLLASMAAASMVV